MAPFDRPYATFYTSAIVNIALSRVRVRVMVRVSLSNLHVLTKSILSNRFLHILLIRNPFILMRRSSSVVNPLVVTALLLMSFLHCW